MRCPWTYGPDSGEAVIHGRLTLNPGPEGEVQLQRVRFEEGAELVVLSGSENSIKLQQTIVKQLKINAVNNGGKSVRIEVGNGTQVEEVDVQSDATLESSSDTGKLGVIKLSAASVGKTLELRGNIDGDVRVDAPGSTIKLSAPSNGNTLNTVIAKLTINANAAIHASLGTKLSTLHVTGTNTGVDLAGEGEISEVAVDESASGSRLNIDQTANIISVKAGSPVLMSGNAEAIVNIRSTGTAPVSVEDEIKSAVKDKALQAAKTNVDAVYPFTVYSQQLLDGIELAENAVWLAGISGASGLELEYATTRLTQLNDDIEALVLEVDTAAQAVAIVYEADDSAAAVTNDITLPLQGAADVEIGWTSSMPSVISNEGTVNRQTSDTFVTLTALVSKNGYIRETDIIVCVLAEDASEEEPATAAITLNVYENRGSFSMTDEHEVDGIWQIQLGNASLPDDWNGEHIEVRDLPEGLTYTASIEPGTDGAVLTLHVSGTAANAVTETIEVSLIVKSEAVKEPNRTDSSPLLLTIASYESEPNAAPVAKEVGGMAFVVGDGVTQSVKLEDLATDADSGDTLTIISASVADEIVDIVFDDSEIEISALSAGSTTLSVVVRDSRGATVTVDIQINVAPAAPAKTVVGLEIESTTITVTTLTHSLGVMIVYSDGSRTSLSSSGQWSSSDTSVANVLSTGTLVALKLEGETIITVSYMSEFTLEIRVIVQRT